MSLNRANYLGNQTIANVPQLSSCVKPKIGHGEKSMIANATYHRVHVQAMCFKAYITKQRTTACNANFCAQRDHLASGHGSDENSAVASVEVLMIQIQSRHPHRSRRSIQGLYRNRERRERVDSRRGERRERRRAKLAEVLRILALPSALARISARVVKSLA